MPFFQNPFPDDFEGNLALGDRHHIPKFVVKGNAGRGKELVAAWNKGPFNLSGNDGDGNSNAILKISFRLHNTKNWATLSVDVTVGAGSAAAVKEHEIVAALNANALFVERFEATVSYYEKGAPKILIKQKKPITEFNFYVQNGQADSVLGFNARAGVAELPSYFARHTIANRFTYADGQGVLIQLDPVGLVVDAAVIDNAVDARGISLGYASGTVQKDWQLLTGRSGIFQFRKGPSSNAVSTTEVVIEYPAGAKVGDLALKITTKKDAGGVVVQYFEEPYTLTSGDMITPP